MTQFVIYKSVTDSDGRKSISEVSRYASFDRAYAVMDSVAAGCDNVVRFENNNGFWGRLTLNDSVTEIKMWIDFE